MGATITVINPTTAAVSTKQTIDARLHERITIAAPGLAGSEEVAIFMGGGNVWAVGPKLTAATQTVELPTGLYGVTKTATVAAVSVEGTLLYRR